MTRNPPDRLDDVALVTRARAGDRTAFEELVRRHYRAAYVVALAVAGSRADAEDICQDAWVRALERLDSLRQAERFVPWLMQVVRNTAHNHRDHSRLRRAAPLETPAAAGAADPRQDPTRAILATRLEAALAELGQVQREIVLLHDLEGWDHRAIAAALGLTETNSRQHLFQARRRLRRLLEGAAPGDREDGR